MKQSLNNMAAFYSVITSESPIPDWEISGPLDPPSAEHRYTADALIACPEVDAPLTMQEVEVATRSVRAKSAQGPDSIHPVFIRGARKPVIVALHMVFSFCWSYGVIPHQWKQANTTPIYKSKGPRSDPSSYRPVSVTSILMRIFEKIAKRRLVDFLETKHFFNPNQAGFRRGGSTYDNIYRLQKAAYMALQRKDCLPIAFLDIQKALDRVPHDRLLQRLATAGITGRCFAFVRSFLRDRVFRVVHHDHCSDWHDVHAGVPQGTVLAPLLFIIYINDLFRHGLQAELILFADDISVVPRMHPGADSVNTNSHSPCNTLQTGVSDQA